MELNRSLSVHSIEETKNSNSYRRQITGQINIINNDYGGSSIHNEDVESQIEEVYGRIASINTIQDMSNNIDENVYDTEIQMINNNSR